MEFSRDFVLRLGSAGHENYAAATQQPCTDTMRTIRGQFADGTADAEPAVV